MTASSRIPRWRAAGAAIALAALAGGAHAETFTFDFENLYSVDDKGADGNARLSFELGAGAFITGFGWDIDVTAFDPSFLSELTLDFTNTLGVGAAFSPAPEAYASGSWAGAGSVDLVNTGVSFHLQPDGMLHLEFHEFYDDEAGVPDGLWRSGSLSFDYVAAPIPEPATYALWASGLLAVAAWRGRRRRPGTAA